jgi:hypothetical protein
MTMNKKYRPGCGDEGEWFMGKFCYQCYRYNPRQDVYCKIIPATMFIEKDDPDYPTEWIYQEDGTPEGIPTCTAFNSKQLKRVVTPRIKKRKNQLPLFP